jgi:hypothetical protein
MAEVEILTEQVTHLRQLDYRYGSGRLREQVVSLLNREANELLHGSYSAKTGKALLIAVAQATKLAGFTAADVGRPALAQRYFIQGLDLAMAAGDRRYAAAVLSEMSRLTAQIALNALTEHDRLRNGRQTVALARRRPLSCTRWKRGVSLCPAMLGRLVGRCWEPSGATSRCAPRTSRHGWASTPKPRSRRTSESA